MTPPNRTHYPRCRLAILATLALAPAHARAVILYGPEGRNTTPPADVGYALSPQGQFGGFLGTSVGGSYFVTAAHVGAADAFILNGKSYPIDRSFGAGSGFVRAPGSDLAVFKVVGKLPDAALLPTAPIGVGTELVLSGRGTQRGEPVYAGGVHKGWLWGPSDGLLSWGSSVVSGTLDAGPGVGKVLQTRFDAVNGRATLSAGDSGGAAFAGVDGDWILAGINYAAEAHFSLTGDAADPGFHAALFDTGGLWRSTGASPPYALVTDRTADQPAAARLTDVYAHLDTIYAHAPTPLTVLEGQLLTGQRHFGQLEIAGDALTLGNGITPSTLRTGRVHGSGLEVQHWSTLTVRPRAAAQVTSDIRGLSVQERGKIDLADTDLILRATDATRLDVARDVREWVTTARSAPNRWTGFGIGSSSAAADPLGLHALAVVLNSDEAGAPLLDSFNGIPVDRNSVLVKYTLAGDADLDGDVDAADYFRIDRGRAQRLPGWRNGDFDYSAGPANADDLSLMDRAFLVQRAAALSPASVSPLPHFPTPPSVVPEPTPSLLLLSLIPALRRRPRAARS